jgi:putative DNA primase/helicase
VREARAARAYLAYCSILAQLERSIMSATPITPKIAEWLPSVEGGRQGQKQNWLLVPLLTDTGNAERFVLIHRDSVRYCHAFKCWFIFDGRIWVRDDRDQIRTFAKQTMIETLKQASAAGNEPAEKFARASLDSKRITNMLWEAQPDLAITPDDLDTHSDLLVFTNGTVNLKSGELAPHDRDHFITKMVRFEYNASAVATTFLATIARLMGAGPDASEGDLARADRLVSAFQVYVGYSPTGHTSEKVVFILFGGGNNGKTTMLSLFLKLLEDYAAQLLIENLMVRQENNNSNADLADLHGARFVMTSETEEGQRLAEGKLKRITQGMGRIKAIRKYENPFSFLETHKLWIDANHKPVIRGTDAAIWNRLLTIPFTVTIPPAEIDRDLPAKLMAEAEVSLRGPSPALYVGIATGYRGRMS